MNSKKLSIVIPVYNEGANINIMLKILKSVVDIEHEILIVHDTETDNCVPIVKSLNYNNVRLVHNKLGRGVTNAIKSGINESVGEYILLFAIDEIGPVLVIDDMIHLLENGCDFVSATRYSHGGRRLGGSLIEGILSRIGNRVFQIVSGSVFTDSTTGIKMFRKSIFNTIRIESKPIGWVVALELSIKSQVYGLRLGEVPIVSIDRLYGGKSAFSLVPWFKEYFKWFIWGIVPLHQSKQKMKPMVKIPMATAL